MEITRMVGPSVSDMHSLILQRAKHRKRRINSNALAYCPIPSSTTETSRKKILANNQIIISAIKESHYSLSKLMLIADFIRVANTEIIEKLVLGNRFDTMSKPEILNELVKACD